MKFFPAKRKYPEALVTSEEPLPTIYPNSRVDRLFLSGHAAAAGLTIAIISLIFGAVSIIYASPQAAIIATLLSGLVAAPLIGIGVASLIVRQYVRQVQQRYHEAIQYFRARLDAEEMKYNSLLRQNDDASEAMHLFIHTARDEAVDWLKSHRQLCRPQSLSASDYRQRYHRLMRDYMQKVAEHVVRVFQPLVPPRTNLWAALREARVNEVESKTYFHTFVRTAGVNPDREQSSTPVAEDRGLPRYLWHQYDRRGDGIVILGRTRSVDEWEPCSNDHRSEDLSVMAGPIILKSSDARQMTMILYVNSSEEGVFADEHKAYMKCCTDAISMFINVVNPYVESVARGV